jgi:hypothetical protein
VGNRENGIDQGPRGNQLGKAGVAVRRDAGGEIGFGSLAAPEGAARCSWHRSCRLLRNATVDDIVGPGIALELAVLRLGPDRRALAAALESKNETKPDRE